MKTKKFYAVLVLAAFVIGFIACRDDNSQEEMRKKELALLNEYIETNYRDLKPTKSGLYYIEESEGEGDTIKAGDRVKIFYATWLIDSILVDETDKPKGYTHGRRYEPFEFVVGTGSVIAGLDEAFATQNMQKGTVANLVIESKLAYGTQGNYSSSLYVPAFATLLMQVEVYKVYKANQ